LEQLSAYIEDYLMRRGVGIDDVADIVYVLQSPYNADLTMEMCVQSVRAVLKKREVQYALYTGIALDELAERRMLPQPLQQIMEIDEPLYGVDESLALGITNVYGSIGITSFGYLDKLKLGILQQLNAKGEGKPIHVYLDDLVAAVAAAASARLAHQDPQAHRFQVPFD
jgi:phosphatidylglycerophosphatase A